MRITHCLSLALVGTTLLMLFACTGKNHRQVKDESFSQYNDPLVNVNKTLVGIDDERIRDYSKRQNLNLKVNDSGLWYNILEKGTGPAVEKKKVVTIKYKVWLLDGTLCYSSDSTGLKSFIVGQGGVENGLEIGIMMLNEGGKAVFVMPPFLAHGLIGDEKKIPARAIIRYDVEIVKITDY